jgi:stage II sporulation protein D
MRVRPAPTALALLTVAALASGPAPAPAGADGPPGWVVDRVRFEPVASGGGPITAEGTGAYRGAIEVVPGDGGLAVIDDVGLQDYLKGIAEMPPEWPAEALRAQAVAARTYALNQMASTADAPWRAAGAHICPTDACQVYQGLAAEQQADRGRWTAAVDDTVGQVLLSGGKPILAMYSASNGGRSAPGGEPYLRAVNDPDDARSPVSHWRYSLPLSTFAQMLGVPPTVAVVGVARRGASVVFAVKEANGAVTEHGVAADDFRSRANAALGAPQGLPSAIPMSNYNVALAGDRVVIDGRGWGHGVGMSQWGARGKAQRGLSAADILAAYYAGIRPTTLPADQLPPSIRVAVATGRRSVTVHPDRYFRVVTGSGSELGGLEVGRWRVEPAKGGVRVIPPEGRERPLAVNTASVAAADRQADPPTVSYDLSAPAVVTLRYVTPTGQPGSVPPQVVDAGATSQALPAPGSGGDYQVVIEADGGPGRFVAVPLQFEVGGPSRIVSATFGTEPAAGDGRLGAVALALVLLSAMGLAHHHARVRQPA